MSILVSKAARLDGAWVIHAAARGDAVNEGVVVGDRPHNPWMPARVAKGARTDKHACRSQLPPIAARS